VTCISLGAQTEKTITILMLDSKTGNQITKSEFEITMKQEDGAVLSFVLPSNEGTGEIHIMRILDSLDAFAVRGTDWNYVNCDCVKDHTYIGRSYSVATILKSGVVAPNYCNRKNAFAKPGEFIFYVRLATLWERSLWKKAYNY
jgi:hypothetical protein